MRQIIVIEHMSLDGVIQGGGGPEEDTRGGFTLGGWFFGYGDASFGEIMMETLSQDFDLLLGRWTYEIWAAYWPYQGDNPIGTPFNSATKYVASNTLRDPAWEKTVVLGGDAADEVRRLKAGDGPDLHVYGSSKLVQSLIAAGLVDEFRLAIAPVVLGTGWRLFGEGTVFGLELVESKASSTGVMLNTYRPAGPVEFGTFADRPPSEAELARRERFAAL